MKPGGGPARGWFPWFPLKSIQSSISAAFSCLILFSIVTVSWISYRLSADAVEQNARVSMAEIMQQVNANIQSYIDNMENISILAMTNKDVKYYISDSSFISEEERRAYEKRISDLFQSILYTRKDIGSIMVFGYNGRFVSDRRITSLNPNAKLAEQPWYKNAQRLGGRSAISPPHVQNVIQNEYRWVVSLSRELKSTDGIRSEGIFLVDLNLSVINEICSNINLGKRGYVFIADQDGNLVYHPQQQLIYSHLRTERIDQVMQTGSGSFTAEDSEGKRIYSVQDTRFGWKIVGVAYTDELIANKSVFQTSFWLWGGLGLLISLLISFLLSHRLSRPIKNLQSVMKQVERGNFDVRAEITQVNEIGQLGRTFNHMVGETKRLMHEMFETQENKRLIELKLLQSQINPHFLYNTLDSIIWMAEQKKHEEVVEMTSALAKLFRAGITKDEELVPVRVELEHITNYLLIQKMRYKDQLDYRIDVPAEMLHYKTVKILLQPFVENAIYHGIRGQLDEGLITVTGREEEDCLRFEVRDNGAGMSPEQLERLTRPEADGLRDTRRGIGIPNVHERVRLYFGSDYGITIDSVLDQGTLVTITIPKHL
ncbi:MULTISPECIES: cache domain-containing sensor histidine kinase [Paenibacillus]|uniref:cache domain-containing sensor histidine kinase n=1 Tax=Paenibacillus TaxID=44249 RepID=UPI0022B92065|nr:sensor histidine kinase [Paenibacillus caseinilyticus]MCZ8519829.1 sensor histidine kinase [Paenibacillus caseinilyticus]